MKIGGISIILILGIGNFLLLLFQVSSGRRRIKVPFRVHRRTGLTLFIMALIPGTLAVLTRQRVVFPKIANDLPGHQPARSD